MPNQITLDPDGFIRETYEGDQDSTSVSLAVRQTMGLIRELQAEDHSQPIKLLVDLRRVGNQNLGARQTGGKALQSLPYSKIAIFGGSKFLMAVANLLTSASGKRNIRQFATEDDAIKWLNR
jgi:hypothetical protein